MEEEVASVEDKSQDSAEDNGGEEIMPKREMHDSANGKEGEETVEGGENRGEGGEEEGHQDKIENSIDQDAIGDGNAEFCARNEQNERRKSTRIKKEPNQLVVAELSETSRPPVNRSPRYRFFRPQKRIYKTSGLADKNWTIEEREKLLDAVSKVDAEDYVSIADIIGTDKTTADVREYLNKIRIKAKEMEVTRQTNLFESKPHPHTSHLVVKEDGDPIERWLRVIDHLVSDNGTLDVSKVIPDVVAVIANLEQNQDPGTLKSKAKDDAAATAAGGGDDEEAESTSSSHQDKNDDAVAPINYKLIYEYIHALLRGKNPPALDPIESWVILDLISDTASELKNSDLEDQKDYLRCIYRDYCQKTLNMKWSTTSNVRMSGIEEFVVKKRRRGMEAEFRTYLGGVVEQDGDEGAERGGEGERADSVKFQEAARVDGEKRAEQKIGEQTQVERTKSVNGEGAERVDGDERASTSSSSSTNGHVAPDPKARSNIGDSDSTSFHNIMIGGLKLTKNAQDFGPLFTLNPLGIPTTILNPKLKDNN